MTARQVVRKLREIDSKKYYVVKRSVWFHDHRDKPENPVVRISMGGSGIAIRSVEAPTYEEAFEKAKKLLQQ